MKILTESQVLKMTCGLLGCKSASIEGKNGLLFMIVREHDPEVIAKGKTVNDLWIDVLAYSKFLSGRNKVR